MEPAAEELKTWLAREKIRDCVVRVARGEDRRDADLLKASFWPDAQTDFGIFAGNFDDYLAWIVPGSTAVLITQHLLGQSHIELQGDSARVETQVMSYHRIDFGDDHHDVTIGGRYLDLFERRGGEWRIVQRLMLYDWFQDYGVSADWSKGVMGMPFSAEHFSGRAHGDYSQVFFSKRKVD